MAGVHQALGRASQLPEGHAPPCPALARRLPVDSPRPAHSSNAPPLAELFHPAWCMNRLCASSCTSAWWLPQSAPPIQARQPSL